MSAIRSVSRATQAVADTAEPVGTIAGVATDRQPLLTKQTAGDTGEPSASTEPASDSHREELVYSLEAALQPYSVFHHLWMWLRRAIGKGPD